MRTMKTLRNGAGALLVLAALICAAGCSDGAPSLVQPQRLGDVELVKVEHPNLSSIDPASAEQLLAAQRALAAALERAEPAELARKFGRLGQLYHAYGMAEPAAAAYANAEALAPEQWPWPYLAAVLSAEGGDAAASVAACERALALRPGDIPTLIRAAREHLLLAEPALAIPRFRQAIEAASEKPVEEAEQFGAAARYGLGRALAAQGDNAAAIEQFEAVLAAQPEAGAARYSLALSYRALGEVDKARRLLAQPSAGEVTFPDPEYRLMRAAAEGTGALMHRGGEALMAGRLDEAIEAYRAAADSAPQDPEPRRNLALALLRSGAVAEAIEELRDGLERTPDDLLLRFDLGSALSASGETDLAIEELTRVVEQAPDFVAGHFNLANALIRAGRWAEAGRPLRRVVELDPRHTNARYLLAMRLQQQGQGGKAEHDLRRLLAEHPDHLPSRQGLAALLIGRGDAGGAVALYRQALERGLSGRPAAQIHLALAEIEKRRNRPVAQQASFRAAIATAPGFAAARLAWAAELSRQRRWPEAAEQFLAAARAEPKNGTAQLGAGQTLAAAGDWPAARQTLEQALDQLPQELTLIHALARLLAVAPKDSVRDGQRALELARVAYSEEPNIAHAETVAMAMAEAGDFASADEWISSLLRRVEESGGPRYAEVAGRLKKDRRRYRRGRAVRREVLW